MNAGKMKIISNAFSDGERIPREYTCEGSNINPPLEFLNIPVGTKSTTLIIDDPDATVGVWDHLIVWNIKPEISVIEEGQEVSGVYGSKNDGSLKYSGPCPPSGTHRYFFKLYALDTILDLPEGSRKKEVENAMEGHVLEKAELVGLYSKE